MANKFLYVKNNFDIAFDILDEIALEGLDGVTVTSLFGRLSCRVGFPLAIDESSKKYIWNIVSRLAQVKFYSLPKEREEINIIDWENASEQDKTNAAVSESLIYPITSVSDPEEFGSCADFKTRKDVTESARKKDLSKVLENWGSKLVVVASGSRRLQALCGDECYPDHHQITLLTPIDYVYLEMIGRTRGRGLATAGPGGAQVINKDARGVFYHVSHLVEKGVIKKVTMKAGGTRLALNRFADLVARDPNFELTNEVLLQQLVNELKNRPNFTMPRSEIKDIFPDLSNKKRMRVYGNHSAKKIICLVNVPYRSVFPNATVEEYQGKAKSEKQVPCLKLINPDFDDGEPGDPDDQEQCSDKSQKNLRLGLPMTSQIYLEILNAGEKGISQRGLFSQLDTTMLAIRFCIKKLTNSNAITSYPVQSGRQRTQMFTLSSSELKKRTVIKLQKRLSPLDNVQMTTGPSAVEEKVVGDVLQKGKLEPSRKLLRIGLVLNAIKHNRAMERYQLLVLVVGEEKKRGYKDKMDRRSLNRILDQMVNDGLIKCVTIGSKLYYTDLSYDPDQFTTTPENPKSASTMEIEDVIQQIIIESEAAMAQVIAEDAAVNPSTELIPAKRTHFYAPKFLRLSVLHDMIYYMVRGFTGDTSRSQEELLAQLDSKFSLDPTLLEELPRLYTDHPSCYMFMPPLSSLHDKAPGWCSFVDIILKAPLSVYAKLVNIHQISPDLVAYLEHPLRSYYPISMLPPAVRVGLLNPKQLVKIVLDVRRLCFMGLIRFGRKGPTRKGYTWSIFVNTRASILDTTSSGPGYTEIEPNRSYDIVNYFFRNTGDVKAFWVHLFNVCLETKLGVGRELKKDLMMVREFAKESLVASLAAVTDEVATKEDVGSVPGDKLGAGGLDSSMFSFLRGNWVVGVTPHTTAKKGKTKKKIVSVPRKRLVRTKKRSKLGKKAYDETDLESLKQMNKMRVQWTQVEDNILALCKAANDLLCPIKRSCLRISVSEMRAALRRHTGPESLDKTQRAIARRVVYMNRKRRWPAVSGLVQLLQNLPESKDFLAPYSPQLLADVKPTSPDLKNLKERLNASYHQLVDFMADRFLEDGIILTMQEMEIPDSYEDLLRMYEINEKPSAKLSSRRINEDSIRAIILSSLASASDKSSQATQLFEVYRQFDEKLLRSSIKRLNRQHIITIRKRSDHGKMARFPPPGQSPYQFSKRFAFLLNTKYQQSVYHDAYVELNRLLCCQKDSSMEMNLMNCGPAAFVLAGLGHVTFTTAVPEQFIILDSQLVPAETSAKIMSRYEELNKSMDFGDNVPREKAKKNLSTSTGEDEPPVKKLMLNNEKDTTEPDLNNVTPMEVEDLTLDTMEAKTPNEPSQSTCTDPMLGFRSARIALYVLRDIATREIDSFKQSVRNPIDLFVVSTSKVFCTPRSALARDYGVSDGKTVRKILQLVAERSNLVKRQENEETTLAGISRNCSEEFKEQLTQLFSLITANGVKGATLKEVRDSGGRAADALRRLEDSGIVLRLGVNETRLVSRQYADAWAVRSAKLTRLMREKIKPSEFSMTHIDSPSSTLKRKKNKKTSSEPLQFAGTSASRNDGPKMIQVIMRPWIRVDGSVNRRVLDRLLGSVLGHVMCYPGLTTQSVADKFGPAFSSVWTRELLQILENIGCVSHRAVLRHTPNLFSKGVVQFPDELTGLEEDEDVLVEPKVDAIIKLGQFIGNKSYSKDILTH